MIHYFGFAQVVEADQYDEKPRANVPGRTSRTSPGSKQIFGYYGGSYKSDVVQTIRTECHDYCSFGTGIPLVEQPRSNQAQVRQLTSRIKNENKKTGSYERVTMKEKMTKGETHVEKSTGRAGIANEYKKSATVKIGKKSGYTEYYHEDRVRRVNYDGKSNSRLKQGSKNTSISVNHANAGIKKNKSISVNRGKNTSISVNRGKNKSISVSVCTNCGNNKKGSSRGKRVAK